MFPFLPLSMSCLCFSLERDIHGRSSIHCVRNIQGIYPRCVVDWNCLGNGRHGLRSQIINSHQQYPTNDLSDATHPLLQAPDYHLSLAVASKRLPGRANMSAPLDLGDQLPWISSCNRPSSCSVPVQTLADGFKPVCPCSSVQCIRMATGRFVCVPHSHRSSAGCVD